MSFVHLHTHSEYSLLDGANRIPELVGHVRKLGMDSLAVTDHGNLHAAWAFYEEAKAQKIRPILGFEAYLAFGPRQAREKPPGAPGIYSHLVLLATNRAGYRNLVRLTSIGYTEGFYRRPRIDREVLEQYSEGIVCLAACLSGEVALYLRQGRYEEAKRSAEWFAHDVRRATTSGSRSRSTASPRRDLVTEGMLRAGAGARARRRGDQRRALPAPGGRRGARRAARDRHGQRPRRPEAVPLHRAREST